MQSLPDKIMTSPTKQPQQITLDRRHGVEAQQRALLRLDANSAAKRKVGAIAAAVHCVQETRHWHLHITVHAESSPAAAPSVPVPFALPPPPVPPPVPFALPGPPVLVPWDSRGATPAQGALRSMPIEEPEAPPSGASRYQAAGPLTARGIGNGLEKGRAYSRSNPGERVWPCSSHKRSIYIRR